MVNVNYIYEDSNVNEFLLSIENTLILYGDLETYVLPEYKSLNSTALDPHISDIALFILTDSKAEVVYVLDMILLSTAAQEEIFNAIQDKIIWFYNLPFDAMFLLKKYLILPSLKDVRVLVKLLQNATGSKYGMVSGSSLYDACRDWLGVLITGKGEEQVTDWYPRPLSYEKIMYAANDVVYLPQLVDKLTPLVTNKLPWSPILEYSNVPCLSRDEDQSQWGWSMSEVEQLEHDYAIFLAKIQYYGLYIDTELTSVFQAFIDLELEIQAGQICTELNLPTLMDFFTDEPRATDKSKKILNNPQSLTEEIHKLNLHIDSAKKAAMSRVLDLIVGAATAVGDDETLLARQLQLIEESDLVRLTLILGKIIRYKALQKQQGLSLITYTSPRPDLLGLVCGSYQAMMSTGRTGSFKPNLQQINGSLVVDVELDSPPEYWRVKCQSE